MDDCTHGQSDMEASLPYAVPHNLLTHALEFAVCSGYPLSRKLAYRTVNKKAGPCSNSNFEHCSKYYIAQ